MTSLARRSLLSAVVPLRATSIVTLCLAVALGACGPGNGDRDGGGGGGGDGAPVGAVGRVVVPADLLEAGDVEFGAFRIDVESLRLVSDRGAALDPVALDVGVIDLAVENVVTIEEIPPASYSEAVLTLGGPISLEIEAVDATLGPVHLSTTAPIEWMARCGSGIPVDVDGTLEIRVDLELGDAWEALRTSALPPPTAGVIELDETTAPTIVADFVAALMERLRADCRFDD